MHWDLFCRVVDNFGDIGVCWRLASDLASRGERVRLWVDDASALAWMAPRGRENVAVIPWTQTPLALVPGDVVVEAFGCDPPPAFVARMAALPRPPVWINLEYLSAEAYVARCHRLPSPQQSGPGQGLVKRFFYPGFDEHSGGLIRERDLVARRRAFDKRAWLASRQIERRPGERVVSLFCYDNRELPALIHALSVEPTLLLVAPGAACEQVGRELGARAAKGRLRAVPLPFFEQTEYDHLLWTCDLNFVRGEDSFVRAQWAGRPFVWQAYPQDDGAHLLKVEAFTERLFAHGGVEVVEPLRAVFRRWNGGPGALLFPPLPLWGELCIAWRELLLAQEDLATRLQNFIVENR
jgi:uncharacterized repeat protein (TIGR03837 family)